MTKTVPHKTDIVSDFLAQKDAGSSVTPLGRIAVAQSNYFDIGRKNIKKISFDKSLSPKQLDKGYKKIIDSISKDLDALDHVNELILHSKPISVISWLTNNFLLKSSIIKFTLGTSFVLATIYAIYTLLKTNLYPNPIVFIGIAILCWIVGSLKSLLNKNR